MAHLGAIHLMNSHGYSLQPEMGVKEKPVFPVEAGDLPIRGPRHPRLSRWVWFLVGLILLFFSHRLLLEWTLPRPGINWSPCGDGIDCGRLSYGIFDQCIYV